ncbi:MAG: hypothetical protein M3Y27_26755, partial [Acidobacteriota bacterium]|nr:hypothetical protein [Acidobacteriota bacterium]
MSIAIVIAVHDGLVIAADSASTLIVNAPEGVGVANVYDNANKIFNVLKGAPIGCVTYGTGSIGNASMGTLIKDFRRKLTDPDAAKELKFDGNKYQMEQIAKLLSDFLGAECDKITDKTMRQSINIGLIISGYSSGESLGEIWSVPVEKGLAGDPCKLRQADQVGINWGGEAEVIHRIVLGFSPALHQVLSQVIKPAQPPQNFATTLDPLLRAQLQ